tara:strand:+ start:8966 stop:9289 length:324 start_codon:yes stop_codon:yes gene_type:complete
MQYKLYIDDMRVPYHFGSGFKGTAGWLLAKTFDEAVDIVSRINCCPEYISFDYDLGNSKSGYNFAEWLIEQDCNNDFFPDDFEFVVHSTHPNAGTIKTLLTAHLKNR